VRGAHGARSKSIMRVKRFPVTLAFSSAGSGFDRNMIVGMRTSDVLTSLVQTVVRSGVRCLRLHSWRCLPVKMIQVFPQVEYSPGEEAPARQHT
jgi:hypothetical protein